MLPRIVIVKEKQWVLTPTLRMASPHWTGKRPQCKGHTSNAQLREEQYLIYSIYIFTVTSVQLFRAMYLDQEVNTFWDVNKATNTISTYFVILGFDMQYFNKAI